MRGEPGRRFRFGRATLEARDGDSVLAAVARRGWPSFVRSVRYHRPRGPVCGLGDCAGCLVRLNGRPNVRACRHAVAPGDVVASENSWPSVRNDLLGALDRLLPHGLDTVHGLRRPAWATRLYQRAARRLSGFGRLADAAPAVPSSAAVVASCDVAIVGAGSSGRAVAEAVGRAGARPCLLERRAGAGTPVLASAELHAGTTAAMLSPPVSDGDRFSLLGFGPAEAGVLVRARSVVVATGSYDGALLFEGSDRPGVVTADLAVDGPELPLGETVVVGGGARAAEALERLAGDVVAVVAFGQIGPEVVRAASALEVPLYPRSRIVRALGTRRVRGLEVARRDGGGRFRLSASTVVLAHRRLPNAQLLFQAGARRSWLEAPGAYFPDLDASGRTTVPGLFAVGSAARPAGGPGVSADAVARAALGARTESVASPPPAAARDELLPYYRELLGEPRRGKWVLCPCEDVLLEEVERAAARGFHGIEVVKRYTGVGSGLCQGRYCLPEAILLLAVLEGRPPTEVGFITQRPPLVPAPLGALAALAHDVGEGTVP